jgi:hypothetical protein
VSQILQTIKKGGFMKNSLVFLVAIFAIAFLTSSCATIAGGSKYWAHVYVPNHPTAEIKHEGRQIGNGSAIIKLPRSEAKSLSFTVNENGYEEVTFSFKSNLLRGWALAGTILTWTGSIGGVPIPWGVLVDASTGALVKPDHRNEAGVSKIDHKNFRYTLELPQKVDRPIADQND